MSTNKVISVIKGDGIGPEVVAAACKIIDALKLGITWEYCEAGAEVFKRGLATGVPQETIDSISRNRVVLKGPLSTPVGYGEKSANVTLRKLFETFGNIRPVRGMKGVKTPYSDREVDLVIVRENVEDLYAGIEYMSTPGVAKSLKLISRKGCEKIVRLAFEFARSEGRSQVHCATKSNIMKMAEGTLKRTFEEIAKEYPDIQAQHIIVDNCAHQLVKRPEQFDVIVTTNMNGDILSDLGSALIGGLGFAPGANIGNDIAIFEAVHGSAPKYAGQNTINPSAVIFSANMMLRYLGMFEAADTIEKALLYTLEEGKYLPRDVDGVTKPASTTDFTAAIVGNFGKAPTEWQPRPRKPLMVPKVSRSAALVECKNKQLIGVDLEIEANTVAEVLGRDLTAMITQLGYELRSIANRGVQVFPFAGVAPDVVDSWRCRILGKNGSELSRDQVMGLIQALSKAYQINAIEMLYLRDGNINYTKAQGEV